MGVGEKRRRERVRVREKHRRDTQKGRQTCGYTSRTNDTERDKANERVSEKEEEEEDKSGDRQRKCAHVRHLYMYIQASEMAQK